MVLEERVDHIKAIFDALEAPAPGGSLGERLAAGEFKALADVPITVGGVATDMLAVGKEVSIGAHAFRTHEFRCSLMAIYS